MVIILRRIMRSKTNWEKKVKDSKDLQKLIGKKTALKAFENDAGYMRLKLVD